MKNRKGFISMTLVYSFLTLFLFIMAGIMAAQTEKTDFINYVNGKVDEDLLSFKDKSSTLIQRMIDDNFVTDGTRFIISDIANSSVGNGNGLYFLDDPAITDENADGSSSRIYFYRGTVLNNYVRISVNNVDNYCFRIIRTNESGSIRMMYIGLASNDGRCTSVSGTGNHQIFQRKNGDNAFVGYMNGKAETELILEEGKTFSDRLPDTERRSRYLDTHYFYEIDLEPSNSTNSTDSGLAYFGMNGKTVEYHERESAIKKEVVDPWYEDNLLRISFLFEDAIYCADRSVADEASYGYKDIATDYNNRLFNGSQVYSYKCGTKDKSADRLSLSYQNGGNNTNYNSLRYPVGLPTVIDLIYAGANASQANESFFMHTGKSYWTMSPHSFNGTAKEIIVNSNGKLGESDVSAQHMVYPVVSIKADTIVSDGSGTSNAPYIIDVQSN